MYNEALRDKKLEKLYTDKMIKQIYKLKVTRGYLINNKLMVKKLNLCG